MLFNSPTSFLTSFTFKRSMNTHSAPDQGGDAMELDQTQTSPRSKHALWGFDHPPLDVSRGSNGQHLTSAYVKHTISKDSIPLRKPSSEPSSSPQRRPEALSRPLRNPECSIPLRPEYQIRQGEERFTRVRRNFVNENGMYPKPSWLGQQDMIVQRPRVYHPHPQYPEPVSTTAVPCGFDSFLYLDPIQQSCMLV